MRHSVKAGRSHATKRMGLASIALVIWLGTIVPMRGDIHEDAKDKVFRHVCHCREYDKYPYGGTCEKQDPNTLNSEYVNSVFRVERGGEKATDKHEFIGNATLISYSGHFLTAAHVVKAAQGAKLWLSHGPLDSATRYEVQVLDVGTPGSTPDSVRDDIALLQANNWDDGNHDPANPVPLRYSGQQCTDGIFIAYSTGGEGPTTFAVTANSAERNPDGCFRGRALPGRSGSLILDTYGFGEGVVAAANFEKAMESAAKLGGVEKFLTVIDAGDNFGAGEIMAGAQWLTKVPLEHDVGALVARCEEGSFSKEDVLKLTDDKRYVDLPLQDIDRLFNSCIRAKLAEEVSDALRDYFFNILSGRCAQPDIIKSVFAQVGASERVLRAQNYLKSAGYSAPALGSPQYVRLLESYVLLDGLGEGGDATVDLNLATAKFEVAIAGKSLDDTVATSIIDDLRRAKSKGAEDAKVNELATRVAIAQNDWDTAAALAAAKAKLIVEFDPKFAEPAANKIEKDITLYAERKKRIDPDAGWVMHWDQINASSYSPTLKVGTFTDFAPKAAAPYGGLFPG